MTSLASADVTRLAEALRESGAEAGNTTQGVLLQSANYIKADMEQRAPVRTGRLRQSIAITVDGSGVKIGPHTEYAAFVEFGTKPHVIEARNKKALAFMMGNTRVVVKRVNHPGSRAKPFVRPAFEDWVNTLGVLAAEANIQRIQENYNK